MKSKIIFLAISVCIFTYSIFAQEESIAPVLALSQSTQLYGMGQVGTVITFNDPSSFYHNPANLGFQSREINFASSFLTKEVEWLGDFGKGFPSFKTESFMLGYKFIGNPISIGFAHSKTRYDFQTELWNPNSLLYPYFYSENFTRINTYSIGISYEYYAIFSLGFTNKVFENSLGGYTESGWRPFNRTSSAQDYGVMAVLPISKLWLENYNWNLQNDIKLKPLANFSVGISVLNCGEKIYYIDQAASDPIPKSARIGYNINLGLDLVYNDQKLNAINYFFIADAEDILIKQRDTNLDYRIEYQNILSDLKPFENLIQLKGTDRIIVHKSNRLELFESLYLTWGSYNWREQKINVTSSGFGVSSKGILKAINMIIRNEIVEFISHHFAIEYVNSVSFKRTKYETEFSSINLYIKNFTF